MLIMKRKITTFISFLAILAVVNTEKVNASEKTFGLRIGYNTRTEAPLAGMFFQYSFGEHFRLSPNLDYYFRHNDVDALSVNCNVHIPFKLLQSGKSALYPLAGLNYSTWSYHFEGEELTTTNDVTMRHTRVGLNLGAGFEYYASPTLKLSVEAKATLLKSYSSGTFTASIGYVF